MERPHHRRPTKDTRLPSSLLANLLKITCPSPARIAAEHIGLVDAKAPCRSSVYHCPGTDQHDVSCDKSANVDTDDLRPSRLQRHTPWHRCKTILRVMNGLAISAVVLKRLPIPPQLPGDLWVEQHVTEMLEKINEETAPRLSDDETSVML